MGGRVKWSEHPAGVRDLWHERKGISLSAQAQCEKCQEFRVVAATDGESTALGLRPFLPIFAQSKGLSLG